MHASLAHRTVPASQQQCLDYTPNWHLCLFQQTWVCTTVPKKYARVAPRSAASVPLACVSDLCCRGLIYSIYATSWCQLKCLAKSNSPTQSNASTVCLCNTGYIGPALRENHAQPHNRLQSLSALMSWIWQYRFLWRSLSLITANRRPSGQPLQQQPVCKMLMSPLSRSRESVMRCGGKKSMLQGGKCWWLASVSTWASMQPGLESKAHCDYHQRPAQESWLACWHHSWDCRGTRQQHEWQPLKARSLLKSP